MTNEQENNDRNIKKTQKIVLFVVVPILILLAIGIFTITHSVITDQPYFTNIFNSFKPSQIEIIKSLDLHCYSINWFGANGFQITYKETIENVAQSLANYDYNFVASEFFKNEQIKDYMVMVCPHLDSKLEAPEVYDPNIGKSAIDKCFEKKVGTVGAEDYCLSFKK